MKPTAYQSRVNVQTGALGPVGNASWPNLTKTTGNVYSLSAQPLVYSPASGKYITGGGNETAAIASVSFSSFGKKRRKYKKSKKSKKCNNNNYYDDLDFGFGRSRFGGRYSFARLPVRRMYIGSRRRSSRRRRRSRPKRYRWKAPSKVTTRRSMLHRCGPKCFLIPNPRDPKFPICTSNCKKSVNGLHAAYVRAKQWKYNKVARKAARELKKMGVDVGKSKRKSRRRKRSKRRTRRRSRR